MLKSKLHKLSGMRSFLLLWGSQAVSLLGSEMTNFALTVHVYNDQGTATSIALLRTFYFLPSVFLCFAAGALADRWDKKKVMLAGVLAGALATLAMFLLSGTGALKIWHLYAINFSVSFVNAFVNPAINVGVTLLSPKDQYIRVSGMLLFSSSAAKIAGPVLATWAMSDGGIRSVFILDIFSFAVAFAILLLFIKIPAIPDAEADKKEPFLKSCLSGISFLKANRPVLKCILFLTVINLLSSLGGDGLMPAMVLARTGGNELSLSAVISAVNFGMITGSIAVTFARRIKNKTRVMFLTCAFSFLICEFSYSMGRSLPVWIVGAFLGWMLVPFISANNSALMRSNVPVSLQGRVFAARDTIQYAPIPLALFLGGVLADKVFEPFMLTQSPAQKLFSMLVGTGKGSGMAVIMLCTGVAGFIISLVSYRNPIYRELDY